MYKNNSGLIAKTKVTKYKKGLCLSEKLMHVNPLLFLYQTVVKHLKMLEHNKEVKEIIQRNLTEESSESEIEDFISDLKRAGSNPIITMKIIVEKLNIDFGKAKDIVFNSSAWNFLYSQPNPFNQEFLDIASEDADEVERIDGKVVSVKYKLGNKSEKQIITIINEQTFNLDSFNYLFNWNILFYTTTYSRK